ncbi:MAG: hypothetical protein ACI87O_003265 [Planctomycetota bacterium]|jgi:hypothetical protein
MSFGTTNAREHRLLTGFCEFLGFLGPAGIKNSARPFIWTCLGYRILACPKSDCARAPRVPPAS